MVSRRSAAREPVGWLQGRFSPRPPVLPLCVSPPVNVNGIRAKLPPVAAWDWLPLSASIHPPASGGPRRRADCGRPPLPGYQAAIIWPLPYQRGALRARCARRRTCHLGELRYGGSAWYRGARRLRPVARGRSDGDRARGRRAADRHLRLPLHSGQLGTEKMDQYAHSARRRLHADLLAAASATTAPGPRLGPTGAPERDIKNWKPATTRSLVSWMRRSPT